MAAIELKMNSNYQDTLFSLQTAELLLRTTERKIAGSKRLPAGVLELPTQFCAAKIYQVTVAGSYNKVITYLQSTYALVGNTKACRPKPPIHTGRLSWRILERGTVNQTPH